MSEQRSSDLDLLEQAVGHFGKFGQVYGAWFASSNSSPMLMISVSSTFPVNQKSRRFHGFPVHFTREKFQAL